MTELKPVHLPVLLDNVVKNALPENGEVFADCTFGLGGHTNGVLKAYSSLKRVIGIDRDSEILEYSKTSCNDERVKRYSAKASELPDVLKCEGLSGVDGILMDLGVSSWQLDCAERGFSFMKNGPLDMRMCKEDGKTAADIVNNYDQDQLTKIFFEYGEEKFSRRIASAIVQARKNKFISETDELAEIIKKAVPSAAKNKEKIHPATRVFQALRIAVNDELGEIEDFLSKALSCLNPGGHLSIISFHSLEDRIVKSFMQKEAKGCICPPEFPVCVCGRKPTIKLINRKPFVAEEAEVAMNPRSRSARLRCAVKL